jgi:hypothetical protein
MSEGLYDIVKESTISTETILRDAYGRMLNSALGFGKVKDSADIAIPKAVSTEASNGHDGAKTVPTSNGATDGKASPGLGTEAEGVMVVDASGDVIMDAEGEKGNDVVAEPVDELVMAAVIPNIPNEDKQVADIPVSSG